MKTTVIHHTDRESGAYVATIDHKTNFGKEIIAAIRRGIKKSNLATGKKAYVKLQGRLGKNNENAFKYAKSGQMHKHCWVRHTFGPHSHRTIRLDDADHVDLYIYERH